MSKKDRDGLLWKSALVLMVGILIVILMILICRKKDVEDQPLQYVGINNCVTKVKPENETGYDSQHECQQNELVRDGYKLINAPGHAEVCNKASSDGGGQCVTGMEEEDCNCYQNKVCVKTGVKDEWTGKMQECKIGDDDCFLTQYGCWDNLNKYKWRCNLRGNGCDRVRCDPGDESCFDTEEQCNNRCNAYCSEKNACIQTTDCVKYTNTACGESTVKGTCNFSDGCKWEQGECKSDENSLRVYDKVANILTDDICHPSIKDCSKRCKNVECRGSIYNEDTTDSCLFTNCADDDLECLRSDVKESYDSCVKGDCANYKCNDMLKECQLADRSEGIYCDPSVDDDCYKGLQSCGESCKGSQNSYKCEQGVCMKVFGNDKERKAECQGKSCYDSAAFCKIKCEGKKSLDGWSKWNGCTASVKCEMQQLGAGRAYLTKQECLNAPTPTYTELIDGKCTRLDENSGCDLVNNPECFSSQFNCEYNI